MIHRLLFSFCFDWENLSNTRDSVFIVYPNASNFVKKCSGARRICNSLLVFGYPDEILYLLFDIFLTLMEKRTGNCVLRGAGDNTQVQIVLDSLKAKWSLLCFLSFTYFTTKSTILWKGHQTWTNSGWSAKIVVPCWNLTFCLKQRLAKWVFEPTLENFWIAW